MDRKFYITTSKVIDGCDTIIGIFAFDTEEKRDTVFLGLSEAETSLSIRKYGSTDPAEEALRRILEQKGNDSDHQLLRDEWGIDNISVETDPEHMGV